MTSPLPPRRRDTRDSLDLLRHLRTNQRQLGVGLVDGRYSPARPLSVTAQDDEGDEDDGGEDEQVLFRNTDTKTAGAGDVAFLLAELPVDGSEHVEWYPAGHGGLRLPASAWSRSGQLLTIPAFDGQATGDVYTCEYAYYSGSQEGPVIVSPADGETVSDTTPTITGTGDPGYTMTVHVDATPIGSVTVDYTGNWTITVGSALSPGNHTITAEETGPGEYDETATSAFVTPSPTAATATLLGSTGKGCNNSGSGITSLALPVGTVVGALLVVSAYGNGASALTVSDSRLTQVGNHMWIGFATTLADLGISANGGFGKLWGVACMALATNAVGWTSAVNTIDTDMSNGETLPIGSVGGVAAAVVAIRDTRPTVSGSTATPTSYSSGAGSPVGQIHTRVDFWTNATITSSPATTAQFITGTHGTTEADVVGLVGP